MRNKLFIGFIMVLCCACNTTKFVPQDEYLLNKVHVKCVDDKTVSTSQLRNYLRQKPNTEILGFWKMQLHVYNTAPTDTTTKSPLRLRFSPSYVGDCHEEPVSKPPP